jgi:voltage-dependent calcium channel T type alpha-1I
VLMKHLDDSNKEAQEDAEMDAEIELEMAHGLAPSPRPPTNSSGALGRGPGGVGSGGDNEGRLCRRCYSPAQVGRGREGQGWALWGRMGS